MCKMAGGGGLYVSHSYVQNIVHLVFSTEERRKLIPAEFQSALWAYVAGVCKKNEIFVHAVGGMDDHVHSVVQIPATLALARAVLTIKSNSSRWTHERGQKGRMAGRLRGVQRQCVEFVGGGAVYTKSGRASSKDEFRGGVCRLAEKAWRGI